jgi:hypothetical protein
METIGLGLKDDVTLMTKEAYALASKLDIGLAGQFAEEVFNFPATFYQLRGIDPEDSTATGTRNFRIGLQPSERLVRLLAALRAGNNWACGNLLIISIRRSARPTDQAAKSHASNAAPWSFFTRTRVISTAGAT